MPILYRTDAKTEEGYHGIPRTILVDARHGAKSLWVGRLEIDPGTRVGLTFTLPQKRRWSYWKDSWTRC